VRLTVLPWGFFLEGEDSHGDHGLGSLVELRFKVHPGTSYSYITIHLEVHKGHVVCDIGRSITKVQRDKDRRRVNE
jgi:hypothetical protein